MIGLADVSTQEAPLSDEEVVAHVLAGQILRSSKLSCVSQSTAIPRGTRDSAR